MSSRSNSVRTGRYTIRSSKSKDLRHAPLTVRRAVVGVAMMTTTAEI
jgi:hypothetical protein